MKNTTLLLGRHMVRIVISADLFDGGLLDVVVHGLMDGEAMENGCLVEFNIR